MTIGTCLGRTDDLGLLGSGGMERSKESCGEDPIVDMDGARGTSDCVSEVGSDGFLSRVNADIQDREDNWVGCFLTDFGFCVDLLLAKDRPDVDCVSEVDVRALFCLIDFGLHCRERSSAAAGKAKTPRGTDICGQLAAQLFVEV